MPALAPYDKLAAAPASRVDINRRRDELELSPLLVDGVLLDVDDRSDKRMAEAIEAWDALGRESIAWTLADNSVVSYDRDGLIALYSSMRAARALRAIRLHEKAAELKAGLPAVTLRDVEDCAWLE